MIDLPVKKPFTSLMGRVGAMLLLQATLTAAEPERLHWSRSTPLPEPRAGHAAGILDGKLVMACGTYWEW